MISKRLPFLASIFVASIVAALITGCASSPEIGEAESAQEEGDYQSALARLDEAIAQDSANVEAYQKKASLLRQMADSNMASDEYIDLYRRAQAAEDSVIAYRPRRENKIQSRREELFRREMERGEKAYNRANKYEREALYRQAISFFGAAGFLQPDSARPVLNEAFARLRVDQQSEVIPVFEEYVDRADTTALEAGKILGQLYLSTGQYDEAIELLDQATLFHPTDQALQTLRLKAYNQSGRVDEALLAYREQIEQNPQQPSYRYNYGSLLLKAARYSDAIRELEKAVELRPAHAESQYNLGAAYLNAALARDDSISTLQEQMEAGEFSTEDVDGDSSPEERLESLRQRRQAFFEKAVPPLERARKMTAQTRTEQEACRALLVAYVQTQRPHRAAQMEGCTGLSSANRQ